LTLRAWILSSRAENESLGGGLYRAFFAAICLGVDLGSTVGLAYATLARHVTYWRCSSYKRTLLPPAYLGHSVPLRRVGGETTVGPRRVSHVGRVTF